jgi:lysophospholipase L1-like esterase
VHLNCGLHDLKRSRTTGAYQVPLEQYEANLHEIVRRVRTAAPAAFVFATTTPILDARHAARKVDFDRFQADVERYNAVALRVMRALDVPIDDLHRVVEEGGPEVLLGRDGTHYTPDGYARLAAAVVASVRPYLDQTALTG